METNFTSTHTVDQCFSRLILLFQISTIPKNNNQIIIIIIIINLLKLKKKWQTDARTAGIDEKIAKLDNELRKYREQLKKMPPGGAKVMN